ncbi:MAG: hypothetical protein K2Q06_05110 [Parvularculaceae bacterium]|nr:hypothetical protein [Parvularculaceae bacterium]
MKKQCIAALAATAATFGLASAQGTKDLPPGMTLGDVRSAISQLEGVKIIKEQVTEGQTMMLLSIEDIPFVVAPTCKADNCTSVAMLSVFPAELKSNAAVINAYNANSPFGWLATDPNSGRIATRHAALLMGNTKTGLQMNLVGFVVFYSVIGEALVKGGGANTISFDGVEVAPRDRVDVEDSRPPTTFTLDRAAFDLISAEAAREGVAAALGDAQTYGRLRKISNDILGR